MFWLTYALIPLAAYGIVAAIRDIYRIRLEHRRQRAWREMLQRMAEVAADKPRHNSFAEYLERVGRQELD